MRDPYRPRFGRWPLSPSLLGAIGWVMAILLVAVGARLASARGSALRIAAEESTPSAAVRVRGEEARAAMARAEAFLHSERERLGIPAEGEAQGDSSGLLGGEVTPLMTTLGSLEAKRLSTNPEWASVMTERLAAAGIGHGDVVAAGFSGSFPGLNLALITACQALGAQLVAVSSVTASTWGANQPGFTWPEIEARLVNGRLISRVSIAVTAGGDADAATDLDAEGRRLACAIRDRSARALGVPALDPRDFTEAVEQRIAAYRHAANGRPLALYANVGGADASLGRSTAILRLRSGFLPPVPFGPPGEQGVTARLAGEGVRILVLLNVRDLAARWGVPLSSR